ncbi:MAG: DUF3352 domain-containing protein [Candidatus Gracilibacteria bacterium]
MTESLRKYSFIFVISLCAMAILGGCQTQEQGDMPSMLETAEGVKAESFFPEDTVMAMKFGTDSSDQKENLDRLKTFFPQDGLNFVMEELARDFNADFEGSGVTFEDDLLPALGDESEVFLGFFGNFSAEEEPNILVVLSLAQPEKFVEWMSTEVENGQGSMQPYKDYEIYSGPESDSYIVHYKDVLVVGDSLENLTAALDRADTGAISLLSNAGYQRGLETVGDGVAFFYIDPSFSADVLKSDTAAMEEMGDMESFINVLEAFDGEMFTFIAEPEGLRIKGTVYGDAEKWEELKNIANFDVMQSYLYKEVPGDGIVMYSEGSGLKKSFNVLGEFYGSIEGYQEGMNQLKAALVSQGLDLEDDILSFMDKGYAFALYDQGGIIPGFGIFIDAGSNRDGALKTMGVIAQNIEVGLQSLPPEAEGVIVFEKNEEGSEYRLSVDFSALPEEEAVGIPPQIAGENIEFHFGVNDDDLAYFALYSGFDEDWGTVAENEAFTSALDMIPGYDRSVGYFDIDGIMGYVDRVMRFAMVMEGGSEEDVDAMTEYQMVREYLAPMKSLVMGGAKAGDSSVELEGFVTIGE